MHTRSPRATGVCVTKIGRRFLKINYVLGGVWDCRWSVGVEITRGTGEKNKIVKKERGRVQRMGGVLQIKMERFQSNWIGESKWRDGKKGTGETLIKICSKSCIIFPSLFFLVYVLVIQRCGTCVCVCCHPIATDFDWHSLLCVLTKQK